MRTYNELVDISRDSRKQNGYIAIICFLFAAILCGGIVLISLLADFLIVILVPLLIFPILFAFQIVIIYLRDNSNLTLSLVFSGFSMFFKERFRSTYNFWSEVWKLAIVYLVTGFLAAIIFFLSFYLSNFLGFGDMIVELLKLPYITLESVESIQNQYNAAHTSFNTACYLTPALLTTIIALLTYSLNSISFFIRVSNVSYSGKYINRIFIRFKINNFKKLFSSYLSLNWPFIFLFLLGLGVGGYFGYIYRGGPSATFVFALASAFLFSFGIFGSVYFANKEALYKGYLDEIRKSAETVKKEIMIMLNQINVGEDKIEDIINGVKEDEDDENE